MVLSIFPGIDLLGRGFERAGYCVVRGPDLLWGGDVRDFHPPAGVFTGVVGGPPCQDFSRARRDKPTGYGLEMIDEYKRIVEQAKPEWWLMENVPGVPDIVMPGYGWQRLDIHAGEFGLPQNRLRHFQFGHKHGWHLILDRTFHTRPTAPCCMASETDREWGEFCSLQGLPTDYDLPAFTKAGKYRAVGNGVPLPVAAAMAAAIHKMPYPPDVTPCSCGCGRPVTGKAKTAGPACRKRLQRRRESLFVTQLVA